MRECALCVQATGLICIVEGDILRRQADTGNEPEELQGGWMTTTMIIVLFFRATVASVFVGYEEDV